MISYWNGFRIIRCHLYAVVVCMCALDILNQIHEDVYHVQQNRSYDNAKAHSIRTGRVATKEIIVHTHSICWYLDGKVQNISHFRQYACAVCICTHEKSSAYLSPPANVWLFKTFLILHGMQRISPLLFECIHTMSKQGRTFHSSFYCYVMHAGMFHFHFSFHFQCEHNTFAKHVDVVVEFEGMSAHVFMWFAIGRLSVCLDTFGCCSSIWTD